jgi:hypothetical protein
MTMKGTIELDAFCFSSVCEHGLTMIKKVAIALLISTNRVPCMTKIEHVQEGCYWGRPIASTDKEYFIIDDELLLYHAQ